MGPDLQPDVPLLEVLLYGVLNPTTIIIAFLMGRKADDKSKIMIAAFAGAIAGIAVLYLITLLRLWDAPTLARAAAGIFMTSLVAGFVYAGAGYLLKR
jgi:hypothetical protein